jgi:heme exporter protein C
VKGFWWKLVSAVLLLYAVIAGFLVEIPDLDITRESLRNVFFHVGMWFAMFVMLLTSFIFSIRHLRSFSLKEDWVAVEAANTGIIFGLLGLVTGMIWAKGTWGGFWVRDPKLDGAAAGMFIYLAYLILRGSIPDPGKRAKVAAVYNIFAFTLWIVFVLILPRVTGSSIHPGQDGAPVLALDLSGPVRIVFYPAMAGWILLSCWILELRVRISKFQYRNYGS